MIKISYMRILRLVLLASGIVLSSCEVIEDLIPKYYKIEVLNECSSDLIIKSFELGNLIDSIFILSNGAYSKVVDELDFNDHPSLFSSLLVDSVSIIQKNGKCICHWCEGEPLITSIVECPELEPSVIHIAYNGSNKDVKLKEDGKRIRQLYSFTYHDSDFSL